MRDLHELDRYRDVGPHARALLGGEVRSSTAGVFWVPTDQHESGVLKVLASNGMGWDHVSVSLPDRCPTWEEMDKVKELFFKNGEIAMQLHIPSKQKVNYHPYCLHLWRPHHGGIPRPPSILVGPDEAKGMSDAEALRRQAR